MNKYLFQYLCLITIDNNNSFYNMKINLKTTPFNSLLILGRICIEFDYKINNFEI